MRQPPQFLIKQPPRLHIRLLLPLRRLLHRPSLSRPGQHPRRSPQPLRKLRHRLHAASSCLRPVRARFTPRLRSRFHSAPLPGQVLPLQAFSVADPSSTAVPVAPEALASVRRGVDLPARPELAVPCIPRAASPAVDRPQARAPASASPALEWVDAPVSASVLAREGPGLCLLRAKRRVLSALRPLHAAVASSTPRPKRAR